MNAHHETQATQNRSVTTTDLRPGEYVRDAYPSDHGAADADAENENPAVVLATTGERADAACYKPGSHDRHECATVYDANAHHRDSEGAAVVDPSDEVVRIVFVTKLDAMLGRGWRGLTAAGLRALIAAYRRDWSVEVPTYDYPAMRLSRVDPSAVDTVNLPEMPPGDAVADAEAKQNAADAIEGGAD